MTDNIYGTPIRCQELYFFICFNTCNVCSNSRLVNSILRFRERSRDLDRSKYCAHSHMARLFNDSKHRHIIILV